ncbi:ABC transporter ATP-binding protein [uncultured Aquincola sp.]|uniref:ABC transporter ATP-binding protein n=1 Tax=uncultured Aquincola sp. TaxID=886556 RepID=UPI0032B23328|tara:strand:+ start:2316 stop:3089 length:774 start_codon:yes stop_codon:yes gene_type:complete
MTAPPPLLQVWGVCQRFGGVQALADVDLCVAAGEIQGLIGPNGAGKTTLFNVITGIQPPDAGRFMLAGRPDRPATPQHAARAGIARTFQNIRLFAGMTVLENVMVGRHLHSRQGVFGAFLRHAAARREEAAIRAAALRLLRRMGMDQHADRPAGQLAYADQRRVEIARALAAEPILLALDEPAAGMNDTEKQGLRDLLLQLQSDGTSILLIEHDVKLVMGLCQTVTVMDRGRCIARGSAGQVQAHPAVIDAYLGAPG